jgi:hypothetical protein
MELVAIVALSFLAFGLTWGLDIFSRKASLAELFAFVTYWAIAVFVVSAAYRLTSELHL